MLKLPENFDYINETFPRLAFIIRKICENYKEGQILDVGCGRGMITKILGELDVDILGIDIDENEIKKASDSNVYQNVQFNCVNISEITDKKFSGILLIEVLEHIEEWSEPH